MYPIYAAKETDKCIYDRGGYRHHKDKVYRTLKEALAKRKTFLEARLRRIAEETRKLLEDFESATIEVDVFNQDGEQVKRTFVIPPELLPDRATALKPEPENEDDDDNEIVGGAL